MVPSTLLRHYYTYVSQLIDILGSCTLWRHYYTYLSQLIDILGSLHPITSLLYIFIPVNWYSWFPLLYYVIIIHIYPSYLIFFAPSTLLRHYYTYLSQLINILGSLHSMTSLLYIFIPVNWYSWFPPLYYIIIMHIYPS